MNLDSIAYSESEKIIADFSKIKVEIKGIGPVISVLPKSNIILTNERIIISQKALFRAQYFVKYIIWFDNSNHKKTHRGLDHTELVVSKKNTNRISYKGQIINELNLTDEFVKTIRIFKDIIPYS